MEIIKKLQSFEVPGRSVVTIGKFDGLHLGHQALIRRTVERAHEQGFLAAVFVIDMSPTSLLTKQERREMLARWGVDLLIEKKLSSSLITTSAEAFIRDTLSGLLHAAAVVVGEDFRFGYERRGNGDLLKREGASLGFEVELIPKLCDKEGKISSSRIRDCVAEGRMEEAASLLGYEFFVSGEIIHGRQIGRTIGVPTANLITDTSKLLPPNGVYYTRSVSGEKQWNGITNVGTKPTVGGQFVGVETYFFDCDEDLYGEGLKVQLLHFARPETRFGSLEELRLQIATDERGARSYFAG